MGNVATNPLPPWGHHRFRAGSRISGGPELSQVATQPLPLGGSPPLQSGGLYHGWPTSGQGGYIIAATRRVPTASERGAQSEVAHKWARRLRNPCRLGGPHRFTAGGRIRGGSQVGKVATQPLPPRGSPPLQSGGHNHRWPPSGQGSVHNPYRLEGPHRFRGKGRIRCGPQVGKVAI